MSGGWKDLPFVVTSFGNTLDGSLTMSGSRIQLDTAELIYPNGISSDSFEIFQIQPPPFFCEKTDMTEDGNGCFVLLLDGWAF